MAIGGEGPRVVKGKGWQGIKRAGEGRKSEDR